MRLDDHDVDAGQPLEVTIAGVNGYSSGDSDGRDEHVGERGQERVFAEEAVRVRRDAGLSDVIIAEATGAKPSTVRGWLSGRSSPTGSVCAVSPSSWRSPMVSPGSSSRATSRCGCSSPGEALEVDLIARGQARRVAKVVSGLEYPGAS